VINELEGAGVEAADDGDIPDEYMYAHRDLDTALQGMPIATSAAGGYTYWVDPCSCVEGADALAEDAAEDAPDRGSMDVRVMLAMALAVLAAVLLAGWLAEDASPATRVPVRIGQCAWEDGSGSSLPCYWDGSTRGNRIGRSYTVWPDGPATQQGQPVVYVYSDHTQHGVL
jgi:hypothetical protein